MDSPPLDNRSFSRLQHPFSVHPGVELEQIDREDFVTCRILCALASLLIVAFWGAYRLTDPAYVDPLWGRLLFASLPATFVLSSYVVPSLRRHFMTAWRFFLYATVAWFSGLSILNNFAPAYGIGMLFIVAATSAGFGVGLHRRGPLLRFLAWTTLVPAGALLAVETPRTAPLILAFSLVSLAIIFYLILGWRIRAENALRESREQAEVASRLKSTIIGNLNHEFRTPLTSILGFADSLANELSGPAQKRARLIHRSGTRLQRTLDNLLALSRLQADRVPLPPERIDLTEQMEEVVRPFEDRASEEGLNLRLDLPDEPIEVRMNPEALSRIVGVLVENAIKFTNEGYIEVRAEVEPNAVVVTVADTGIGISDDARSQLFEPFRQASEGVDRTEEGLGLGLTLVGQLVELMDGSISVESEPGAGTQFEVVLPRNRTNDSSARPASPPALSHKSVG